MIIRGKAPLRVSFSGGGSDVSPYCDKYGGCVLSTTIGMYAYGALEVRDDKQISILSLDYEQLVHYELGAEIQEGDQLAFVRAVIARLDPPAGFNLYLHSDAPPGTGLGSSGTVSALIVGLINHAFNLMLSKYQMARLAYEVEHDDLQRAVGRQDHYAAIFGGMNYMEFTEDTIVFPLRLEPWILEELAYQLQMFYTHKKRDSTNIVATQVEYYKDERTDTIDALARMKEITVEMKKHLVQGQLMSFAELLHEAWEYKKKMNPSTGNAYLDKIYATARQAGSIGGKIIGAGGGGFFLLYTPFTKKPQVAKELEALGVKSVPFLLDYDGMKTWQVPEQSLERDESKIFNP
ncbi:MAG: GHMP kinase [Deltaproteobacteria bacterium]|nr:GHMP kinase [Deltaproteobacteria bacterium]